MASTPELTPVSPPIQGTPLRETPAPPVGELGAALAGVAFACAHCGRTIIPQGALWRVTVRATPDAAETPRPPHGEAKTPAVQNAAGPQNSTEGLLRPRRVAMCTAAFATALADGMRTAANCSLFRVHDHNFSGPTYARDVHCGGCHRYLGYRLEDAEGALVTGRDGRPPFKVLVECGPLRDVATPAEQATTSAARGPAAMAEHSSVQWNPAKLTGTAAVLVDARAWDAVAALLPPLTPTELRDHQTAAPPNGLERTARLLESIRRGKRAADASAAAEAHPAEYVMRELKAARDECEAGSFLMRSLAAPEESPESHPHVVGLRPRDPRALASVSDHVRGERASPYISLSADLSVPLSWALPYGTPAIIVPRWAVRTGGAFMLQDGVRRNILFGGEGENDSEVQHLLGRAAASEEVLAIGPVAMPAVEALRTTVCRVAAGPSMSPSPAEAAASLGELVTATPTFPHFPKSALDFASLIPAPFPDTYPLPQPRPGEETRAASDYFARGDVMALGRLPSSVGSGPPAEPEFLLVRMRPNFMPPASGSAAAAPRGSASAAAAHAGSDPPRSVVSAQLERLRAVLDAGSRQLLSVRRAAGADAVAAYYELDVRLSQQRVVFPSLHELVIERVPVLLIPWGRDAVAVAQRIWMQKELEEQVLRGERRRE